MHKQTHPDTEQLDRLRCGLLDDEPQLKILLDEHIAACPDCMARFSGWNQLHQMAGKTGVTDQQLKRKLGSARQTALAASPSTRPHRLIPLAAAAALLTALSAGLLTLQYNDSGFIQENDDTLAVQTGNDIPDVYEDLDFYLWLATQKENGGATDGNTGANST